MKMGQEKQKITRKIFYVFVFFVFAFFAAYLFPRFLPSTNGMSHVFIGTIEAKIPSPYLFPLEEEGKNILLAVLLPDMRPIHWGKKDISQGEVKNEMLALITDQTMTTTVQYKLDVEKNMVGPLLADGKRYSLNFYRGSKPHLSPPLDGKNYKPEETNAELFINEPNNDPYIICDGDKSAINPGCTLEFTNDGLEYQLSFSKSHLSDWSEIRKKTISLMEGFRTNNNNNSGG